jgi:hypothetical protein
MTADERLALARLKIERANKHIDDLQIAVSTFFDSAPYKVAAKRDPDTRKMIYYLASVEPVPTVLPAIAGDILHCLRDALDHLAQQLYLVGTGGANGYRDKTSFLISPSAKDFKSGLPRIVEGMRQDAIDAISAIEPYVGGKGADLWPFHRLNNIDKHRLIVTVGSAIQGVGIGPIMERSFGDSLPAGMAELIKTAAANLFIRPANNLFPLKAGDKLFIDAADAEEHKDMQFSFEVVIHEPGVVEGKPILETLVQFRDRISGIVDAFRPCLS